MSGSFSKSKGKTSKGKKIEGKKAARRLNELENESEFWERELSKVEVQYNDS
jgi:hypothetical protein